MAGQTTGTLAIQGEITPSVLNDRLHQIRDELDAQMGLRGRIKTYDATQYFDSNGQLLHSWGNSGLTA